jgi:mannose-6-phosphate isomerase-like protein (cupin superfamily)
MMTSPTMASSAVAEGFALASQSGLKSGTEAKVLVRQPSDDGGFSLVRLWFKPYFPLARHSHNVDCLYHVLCGSASMGNVTLGAGDSFFVPAGAPYRYSAGPHGVEVLEIRHGAATFDMVVLEQSQDQWEAMAKVGHEQSEAWSRTGPASVE